MIERLPLGVYEHVFAKLTNSDINSFSQVSRVCAKRSYENRLYRRKLSEQGIIPEHMLSSKLFRKYPLDLKMLYQIGQRFKNIKLILDAATDEPYWPLAALCGNMEICYEALGSNIHDPGLIAGSINILHLLLIGHHQAIINTKFLNNISWLGILKENVELTLCLAASTGDLSFVTMIASSLHVDPYNHDYSHGIIDSLAVQQSREPLVAYLELSKITPESLIEMLPDLHLDAAQAGAWDCCNYLLKKMGYTLSACNEDNLTLFHFAAKSHQIDFLHEHLLANWSKTLEATGLEDSVLASSILGWALAATEPRTFNYLYALFGSQIRLLNELTFRNGIEQRANFMVVDIIKSHNIDIDVVDPESKLLTLCAEVGNWRCFQRLHKYYKNTDNVVTKIFNTALINSNLQFAKNLIDLFGKSSCLGCSTSYLRQLPSIHHAVFSGKLYMVRFVVSLGENLLQADSDGNTALHNCAKFRVHSKYDQSVDAQTQYEQFIQHVAEAFSDQSLLTAKNNQGERVCDILESKDRDDFEREFEDADNDNPQAGYFI